VIARREFESLKEQRSTSIEIVKRSLKKEEWGFLKAPLLFIQSGQPAAKEKQVLKNKSKLITTC